jgi:hypothetical protein
MFFIQPRPMFALLAACLAVCSFGLLSGEAPGAKDAVVAPNDPVKAELRTQFDYLYKLAGPMPDEYAWREQIGWLSRIQEARAKAIAEDKPLFVIVSANAYPLGQT